ncbi:MAG: hypothetical protein HY712_06615 [candidate division NC10 bacterium]|nr:hypothetical protein [candidate division NC10 bacterium]
MNFLPELTKGRTIQPKIIVSDDTLREGEQAGEVSFSIDDKVRLAEKLGEIGIRRVQIGFTGKSAADREVVRRLRANGSGLRLGGMLLLSDKDWQEQVAIACDTGIDVLTMMFPASDIRLQIGLKISRKQMLDFSVGAVE